MSEFQEAHTVSLLKGSPPGYVGYGEGGVLTEAVRRRPYSVVLLDEVEKAHPDVLELFYQVFDKGQMEDAEGREIDFRNTVIVLTTNAATDSLMRICANGSPADADSVTRAIKDELNDMFKPAFLGRVVTIPYYPVRDEVLRQIVGLKLERIVRRVAEQHGARLSFDDSVITAVTTRCTEVESGARNIDNVLTNTLLPELSTSILMHMADGKKIASVQVSVDEQSHFINNVSAI
jgi:type VI secretion system protein VasG